MNTLPTAAERRALGQEQRTIVPRSAHAEWTPRPGRENPVQAVLAAEAGRIAALLPLRHGRMRPDAFAFLRGAASLMAADLAPAPSSGLAVVACGDSHVGNFGAAASPEGEPIFDVNDFDEAARAPFEWDVKRLAASLAVAARVRSLPEKAGRALARRATHAYRRHIAALADLPPDESWLSRIDLTRAVEDIADREVRREVREKLTDAVDASRSHYEKLVSSSGRLHLPERPPAIFRLGAHEATAHAAYAAYLDGLRPERRALMDRYRLRDLAFKAVGVGSVGTFCALGLFASGDGHVLLLQLKEALTSVLEPFANNLPLAPSHGERVVVAQRTMQAAPDAFLGWTETPIDGRVFYIRKLADPKLAAIGEQIEGSALRFYAALCGRTLARAHARSGDAAMIAGYLGDGDSFDAAIGEFAERYADQTERDHEAWQQAIHDGHVEAA